MPSYVPRKLVVGGNYSYNLTIQYTVVCSVFCMANGKLWLAIFAHYHKRLPCRMLQVSHNQNSSRASTERNCLHTIKSRNCKWITLQAGIISIWIWGDRKLKTLLLHKFPPNCMNSKFWYKRKGRAVKMAQLLSACLSSSRVQASYLKPRTNAGHGIMHL